MSRPTNISSKNPRSFYGRVIPVLIFIWMLGLTAVYFWGGRSFQGGIWLDIFSILARSPQILCAGLFWDLILCGAICFLFYGLGNVLMRSLRLGAMTLIERLLAYSDQIGRFSISIRPLFR